MSIATISTGIIVEKIGVDKSLEMIEDADLVIHVLSNNERVNESDKEIMDKLKDKTHITFINKSDFVPAISVTIALFSPRKWFKMLLLPTFGLPIIATFRPFSIILQIKG